MYQTAFEFGKTEKLLQSPSRPKFEKDEAKRRSLFQHLSPGRGCLPSIVSFNGGVTDRDSESYR